MPRLKLSIKNRVSECTDQTIEIVKDGYEILCWLRHEKCETVALSLSAKLRLSDIPGPMLGHFVTAMADGNFPLEMAYGTKAEGPEGVPDMTALAAPVRIRRRLERAIGATDEAAVRTSHRGSARTFALPSAR